MSTDDLSGHTNRPNECPGCGGPREPRDVEAERQCYQCRDWRGRVVELFIVAATPESMARLDIPADRLDRLEGVSGWQRVRLTVQRLYDLPRFNGEAWDRLRFYLETTKPTREAILATRLDALAAELEARAPEHQAAPAPSAPVLPTRNPERDAYILAEVIANTPRKTIVANGRKRGFTITESGIRALLARLRKKLGPTIPAPRTYARRKSH